MKNLIESVLILFSVFLSVTSDEKVIYAQVGETITLKPRDIPGKYVYWYFVEGLKNHQLAWINPSGGKGKTEDKNWTLSLHERSLIISNLQNKQFGKFLAEVTSGVPNSAKWTDTFTPVRVKVTKSDSVFLPGESVSLSCDVESPHQKPDIHWLNPQRLRVKNNRGVLSKTAETQDNGTWTCAVGNEYKTHISVIVVDLAPAPEHQYTSTDSQLIIPCSIPPHISWEHIKQKGVQEVQWHFSPKPPSSPTSDERLRLLYLPPESPLTWKTDQDKDLKPSPDAAKGNLSLYRNRAKVEDRGDYTCSMTFKNGVTLDRTVHVQVLQITSLTGTEIISGQSVNLSCSTGEPLGPDMWLKWFSPEQSSVPKSDRHGALLTIKEAGTGDSGLWRCELWLSDKRLTSAELKLNVEPKLSVWMLAIICSAAVIPVLLLVLAFILCRRNQRKKKHHKHRLCHCRNPKPKGFYRT